MKDDKKKGEEEKRVDFYITLTENGAEITSNCSRDFKKLKEMSEDDLGDFLKGVVGLLTISIHESFGSKKMIWKIDYNEEKILVQEQWNMVPGCE